MASKKKVRKSSASNKLFDHDTMIYIYAIIVVMLTIIGALEMGPIGFFLAALCRYLFGTYYGVVYGVLLIYAMVMLFRKSNFPIAAKKVVGIFLVVLALILWSAIPDDGTLVGFDVIGNYLSNTFRFFRNDSTVLAQGGVVGALLYSITSVLVGKEGTWVVIAAMLVLAGILLISRNALSRVGSWFGGFYDAMHQEREAKPKRVKKQVELQKKRAFEEQKTAFLFDDDHFRNQAEVIEEPTTIVNEPALKEEIAQPAQTQKAFFQESQSNDVEELDDVHQDKVHLSTTATEDEEDRIVPVFQYGLSYRLPPFSLLDKLSNQNRSNANEVAGAAKGKRLIEILKNFGIQAELIATHIGPSVTKFEIRPDSSVKVNRIMSISDNIKMELAARDIRIEAPIPGKNAVGVEIPNVENTMVKMQELVRNIPEDKQEKKMLFVLGKDLMGNSVYCELDKMPHLLVAGATGSGKSVCMNTIITSFIMRARPDEVRLLLIDPKKVEFTPYQGLPHLMCPIIADANEASRALKVIVEMMENRFTVFSQIGVRNIVSYNEKIKQEPKLQHMPYIVVIIDELADLMAIAGKDVEQSIQRITQLARASGIHLIVATQRPSTDVITGIIKANIPSRISFSVSSSIDSRTILDSTGAERLLGNGDMLYQPIGASGATRVQGVYVSDDEVQRIASFASNQYQPFYEDAFIQLEGVENNEMSAIVNAGDDPMYDSVKQYVISVQKASTSLLQRRFSIGYNRAARLIDVLEERGVVGPAQGSKPREVYFKEKEEVE